MTPSSIAVGGMASGADPLAVGLAVMLGIRWFSVAKSPKTHGNLRRISGCPPPGSRVTIVEDVVSTGGSTLRAIAAAAEADLRVERVLVLVDRRMGGMDAIRGLIPGVPVCEVWTIKDLARAAQGS
jgi:orotate phosphoribosyltransferase